MKNMNIVLAFFHLYGFAQILSFSSIVIKDSFKADVLLTSYFLFQSELNF